ncbi:MAG: acetyl-CoA decarbonylase/synthase complex subunit gamma, partial [Acidobacteriota bacterium]
PHLSEEAKKVLGASSEPPICLVKIGGANPLEIGEETVLFRHEKTFFHKPGVAVLIDTSADEAALSARIREIENYRVQRVGEDFKVDLLFISHESKDGETLRRCLRMVKEHSSKGIILDCPDRDAMKSGLELLANDRPAIFLRGAATDQDIELALSRQASLILTAGSLEELAAQAEKARAAGMKSLILNPASENLGVLLQRNTIVRRSALRENFRPFGYPLCVFVRSADPHDLIAKAAVLVCKYASIIILPEFDKALLYALFTLRQNIYTDPQKPIQMEAKIYPIGDPVADSPIFVTTNFSLTYFMVSGEIENSGTSAHLIVCDTEGQSVLTAWAAGKFVPEKIAKFITDNGLEAMVKSRKIVIPGLVSQISGELEEKLPGWQVMVGPQEASDIPAFVKSVNLT